MLAAADDNETHVGAEHHAAIAAIDLEKERALPAARLRQASARAGLIRPRARFTLPPTSTKKEERDECPRPIA
jgi:hypothetical protein